MRYNIANNDRCFSLLANDSYVNPEKITPILKAELTQVAREYLNIAGDVKVRYKMGNEGLVFMIEIPTNGVKPIFYS